MLPCDIVLVLSGFQVMTECNPGMMRGLLMIARFVMLGGLAMMFGSWFIVLRSLFVMLMNLVLCHSVLLEISRPPRKSRRSPRLPTKQTLKGDLKSLRQCAGIQ
jgi:hypothetical protein